MVSIRQAVTKRELKAFMEYPLKLYRGDTRYVPDILSSQVADMLPDKNPAFEFCQAKCFLAERAGDIVGRVAAIINHRVNEKFGVKYVNFTHIDFIDDDEVVDALFAAVEGWAKSLSCEAVHGPLGFSDMDREGLLVEGFEHRSLFYTFYNHPYYVTQLHRLGYQKQIDWLEYRLTLPREPEPQIAEIARHVVEKKKLHYKNLGDKPLKSFIEDMFEVYNEAYLALFGVVTLTKAQVDKYAKEFAPMVDKRTTCFVYDSEDKLVAFGVCCPSLDTAMQKSGGKMFPLGWLYMLKALKGKNDTVDMLLIGVKPELQSQGVNAVVIDDMLRKAIRHGVRYAETGPMLETNAKVLSQWRHFDAVQHKRRRCFVKTL